MMGRWSTRLLDTTGECALCLMFSLPPPSPHLLGFYTLGFSHPWVLKLLAVDWVRDGDYW